MASGIGDILKWGLILGGGYIAWSWWNNQAVTATAPVGPTNPMGGGGVPSPPAPGVPPPVAYTPPSLVQQLQNAAGAAATKLNADQWQYYWTGTVGKPAIDSAVFTALFFPNGRPADASQNPTMTAQDFVSALATKGVSGLGALSVVVPVMMTPRGVVRSGAGFRRYRRVA